MSEMHPDAKALLERARVELSPTDEDRARIRRAVAVGVGVVGAGAIAGAGVASGAGVGASGLSSSVTAASVSGLSLGVKVSLAIVAVAVAAGGTAVVAKVAAPAAHVAPADAATASDVRSHRTRAAHPRALHAGTGSETATEPSAVVVVDAVQAPTETPIVAAPIVPAPVVVSVTPTAPVVVPPVVVRARDLAPERTAVSTAAGSATPRGARGASTDAVEPAGPTAAHVGDTVAAEAALIARAQASLRGGDGGAALALLDEYGTQFPHGSMSEDAASARVLALCQTGRHDDAVTAAAAFRTAYPRSVHLSRLAASCVGE